MVALTATLLFLRLLTVVCFRSRASLATENLALRHLLGVLAPTNAFARSSQNPNFHHLLIALDVLDAALLSSKVGVSRPYDSGRGFRKRQPKLSRASTLSWSGAA